MVTCQKPHIGDFFVRPPVVPTPRGRKPSYTKSFFQPSLRPHNKHSVHRYSVAAITNQNGAVIERYAYNAYGQWLVLDANGNEKVDQTPLQPYGYTGRRYDSETDLWYFRARYYDADLGRFISRDPLQYVDGMSMYQGYFAPNALDPRGLSQITATVGFINVLGKPIVYEYVYNLHFSDCSAEQEAAVTTAAQEAMDQLSAAASAAGGMSGNTANNPAMKKYFAGLPAGKMPGSGLPGDPQNTSNVDRMVNQILTQDKIGQRQREFNLYFECEPCCERNVVTYVKKGIHFWGYGGRYRQTVYLCPLFFDNDIVKGRVLIHEWSHIWNNTADLGYIDSEQIPEGDGLPPVPRDDKNNPITGEAALNNADSVSAYVYYGY